MLGSPPLLEICNLQSLSWIEKNSCRAEGRQEEGTRITRKWLDGCPAVQLIVVDVLRILLLEQNPPTHKELTQFMVEKSSMEGTLWELISRDPSN